MRKRVNRKLSAIICGFSHQRHIIFTGRADIGQNRRYLNVFWPQVGNDVAFSIYLYIYFKISVSKRLQAQLLRHTPLEAEIHWHILNEESFFWARRHGNRSPDDKGKHNRKEQHKTVVAKKLSKIHFFSIFHHFVFFHA